MYRFLIISLFSFTFFFCSSNEDIAVKYSQSIKHENLIKTVNYLASDKLQGRMAGSPGYYLAADFIAEEFSRLGLKPLGNDKYFQPFNVEYNEINQATLSMKLNGTKTQFKLGPDFICRSFTGSGNISADIVFCGYGINDPKTGYNDYKGIDVKDKIVLVFKQNPSWKINDSISLDGGYPRTKALLAYKNGAKGILYVSLPNDPHPQKPIASVLEGNEELVPIPMIHIDIEVANKLFANTKYTLKSLQSAIDSNKTSFSFNTGVSAEMNVSAKHDKNRKTMNVVGVYEGTDKDLKNEYLILGAHLDHVGIQANDVIFPGANDNASGSAAILEIARAFANNKITNKRSIIFILFSSEEAGLLGAKHFVNNLPVPKNKIVAMFNFDCVAHGDSIQIGNGKSAPELWETVRKIDKENFNKTVSETWSGGGADAGPFHDIGIPAVYFVSKFSYTHLHLPSDKPETLNPELFEQLTRLGFLAAYKLVN